MKRPVILIALISFLISFIMLKIDFVYAKYLGIGFIIITGYLWTQKKYRYIYIVLIFLLLVSLCFSIYHDNKYVYKGDIKGNLYSYHNDYIIKNKNAKILIKNDLNKRLDRGVYQIKYEKNEFYNKNPNTFNYKDYLKSYRINDVVYLSEIEYKLIKKKFTLNSYKWKEKIINRFHNSKYKKYIKALILNDKKGINKDILNILRENGTSHILAISGLHIGLIFIIIYTILFFVPLRYRYILSILLLMIYIYIISMPISAIRAFFMLILIYITEINNRRYDILETLGIIGYILILFNPFIVLNISFHYSFVEFISIEMVYNSFFKNMNNKLFAMVFFPLAIQLGMLPLTIYYNHSVHILSFLANIASVFLITMILYISVFTLIIPLDTIIRFIDFLFYILFKINIYINSLDIFKIKLPSIHIILVFLFYIFIILFHEKKYRKTIVFMLFIITFIYGIYFFTVTEVYFLDIGQGDSILIKRGFKSMLIDGGKKDRNLEDILLSQGVRTIDYVIISHSDFDHIGGITDIKDLTKKSIVFYKPPNERDDKFKSIRYKNKYNVDNLNNLDLGFIKLDFIKYKSLKDLNNSSVVNYIDIYGLKMLFTGDIEKEVEDLLYKKLDKVDILKVPHHGSKTSSTDNFIKASSPDIAVICVGKNNYGHPNKEVMKRYKDKQIKIYKTINGCIKLYVLPKKIYFFNQ